MGLVRPRRFVFLLALALTAGIAGTTAAAWWISFDGSPLTGPGRIGWSTPEGAGWYFRKWDTRHAVRLEGVGVSGWVVAGQGTDRGTALPPWSFMNHPPKEQGRVRVEVTEVALGWPRPALSYLWIWDNQTSQRRLVDGFDIGRTGPGGERVILPLRPLWPGFLLNSLLIGALTLPVLMLVAPIARAVGARRRMRMWRGRCPGCGYDLQRRFEHGCSECGWRRVQLSD